MITMSRHVDSCLFSTQIGDDSCAMCTPRSTSLARYLRQRTEDLLSNGVVPVYTR